MTRRILLALVAVFTLVLATGACTPAQINIWNRLNPSQQRAVAHAMNQQRGGGGGGSCHDAVNAVWPAGLQGWAHKIVDRESGGNPGSQNNHSSAAGCFQIVRGTWNSNSNGIPWSSRYDATANVRVALMLYQNAGTSPWRLTNY